MNVIYDLLPKLLDLLPDYVRIVDQLDVAFLAISGLAAVGLILSARKDPKPQSGPSVRRDD